MNLPVKIIINLIVVISFCAVVAPAIHAKTVTATVLIYNEIEEGVEAYEVLFYITTDFMRIDVTGDTSGYVLYNIHDNSIHSVSHFDKSILVIQNQPYKKIDFGKKIRKNYQAMKNAPTISGKNVHTFTIQTVTEAGQETCMDIQLVPGLLPSVTSTLERYQKTLTGQQVAGLHKVPEDIQTTCYLVDQIYNDGEYYRYGLPIQEVHSNGKKRLLKKYETREIDSSLFDLPKDYREYSL